MCWTWIQLHPAAKSDLAGSGARSSSRTHGGKHLLYLHGLLMTLTTVDSVTWASSADTREGPVGCSGTGYSHGMRHSASTDVLEGRARCYRRRVGLGNGI